MKYQSELIKEIVDKRGHKFPSLHYQSECVESWIEETKGSYPKLYDYEGEWLNYIVESPIGEFPYVTLSDVTEATINNVVPYAYKSAILKGQTLVNLVNDIKIGSANVSTGRPTTLKTGFTTNLSISGSNELTIFFKNITPDVARYIILEFDSNDVKISTMSWSYLDDEFINYTTKSNCARLTLSVVNDDKTITTQTIDEIKETYKPMVLSGNHSYIPYFEGMQSVKMPVLTASNEDGTKTNILTVNEDVTLRSNGDICDELNLLTGQLTQRIDENGEVLSQEIVKTVDLNIEDQNGNTLSKIKPIEGTMHLLTNGNPIKPTFTGEVPVEAITQNLASFIEE